MRIIFIVFFSIIGAVISFGQRISLDKTILEIDSILSIKVYDRYFSDEYSFWERQYLLEIKGNTVSLFKQNEKYCEFYPKFNEIAGSVISSLNRKNKKNGVELLQQYVDSIIDYNLSIKDTVHGVHLIRVMPKDELKAVLEQYNRKGKTPHVYLKLNSIDSVWLNDNCNRMYELCLELDDLRKKQRQYIEGILNDFDSFQSLFIQYILLNSNLSSSFDVEIAMKKDTILMKSSRHCNYGVPLEINEKKSYNLIFVFALMNILPDEPYFSACGRFCDKWSEIEEGLIKYFVYESKRLKH